MMADVSEVELAGDQTNCEDNQKNNLNIKEEEIIVIVKREEVECAVCLGRHTDYFELNKTKTVAGTSLTVYLSRYSQDLNLSLVNTKYICKECSDLINVLENAELDYLKLKEHFENVISKNPLFEVQNVTQLTSLDIIKEEALLESQEKSVQNSDSEDLPLILTRKRKNKKKVVRKKTLSNQNKKKNTSKSNKSRWQDVECDSTVEEDGKEDLTARALLDHIQPLAVEFENIKKEGNHEKRHSDNVYDTMFKTEDDGFDDDDIDYVPEEEADTSRLIRLIKKRGPKKKKSVYPCEVCNVKYTSLVRLNQHKLKHEDSKPPYICEVCGAHYKHKRACDIHVALHKGISDWKCEECNKLFPSKCALRRHNNIHTGKLNYQCDLCGKSFIHTSSFKMHKLSHSGVKPHSCDVCGLALMTRSHLKRHKRVHSGEKRHECPVCGKRFSERYNLLAHSKSHEQAEPPPPRDRRRTFRCPYCPERFERRYMLERHTSVVHGRTLERPPPTPRNTMSKLLKAQAQRRAPPTAADTPRDDLADSDSQKQSKSPDTKTEPVAAKLVSHLASSDALTAWASAYTAEFTLRQDYGQ